MRLRRHSSKQHEAEIDCICQPNNSSDFSLKHRVCNKYDVVIIGNGPSAIILSFFLSGNWPYYNGKPIEHPLLQDRLKFCSQKKSLVEEDLDWLSEGLYDSRTQNPVSILLDHLYHPNADMLSKEAPLIEWKYNPENEVNHIVLGYGPPGGAWHRMTYSQLAISLSYWLEFPGLSFDKWFLKNSTKEKLAKIHEVPRRNNAHPDRHNPLYFGLYYQDYVKEMNIDQFFVNDAKVTSVSKKHNSFLVEGERFSKKESDSAPFMVCSRNVVLATGSLFQPRLLDIPGETLPFVHHSVPDLDADRTSDKPVMVVGCGLVAMDSILALMERNIPVLHVFRRDAKDPEIIINHLSHAYGDYIRLKPLMWGKQSCKLYTPLARHILKEVTSNNQAIVLNTVKKQEVNYDVSKIIINIGSMPDLSLMRGMSDMCEDTNVPFHIKNNPIELDIITYESTRHPGVYALGPLAGDNFVRFVMGGALGITSGLFKDKNDTLKNGNALPPMSVSSDDDFL